MATQYLPLTAKISGGEQDEGGFVSYCPELDVASQGETIEEAVRNLQDAVDTYVSALSEMGDLRAVLDERGLKPVLREPKGKAHVEVSPGEFVSTLIAKVDAGKVPA